DNGCDNHTLTLVLKIHLNKVEPTHIRLPVLGDIQLPYLDFNKTPFTIKPWTTTDFSAFSRKFLKQCALWNNHFWLTPPAGFSALDIRVGSRTVRPNIYCHLFVAIAGSAADSHLSIDIVNLDKRATARQLGKREGDLNASDFRSDSGHYDSLDVNPVPLPFQDDTGAT